MPKLLMRYIAATALLALLVRVSSAQPSNDIVVHVEKDGVTFRVDAELSIAAKMEEVWDVLTDFDHMAQILSNVDASKVVNRDGDRFEVVQKSHANAGPLRLSTDSVRQVELSPKHEIKSHLLKGDLKSSEFTTRIAEQGGLTKVNVHGAFVPGGLAAAAITVEAVQAQTQRQYSELRDEVLRRKNNEPTPPCVLTKNCPQGSS
jgi:carbon monoxide dehydrogenase subunit G